MCMLADPFVPGGEEDEGVEREEEGRVICCFK